MKDPLPLCYSNYFLELSCLVFFAFSFLAFYCMSCGFFRSTFPAAFAFSEARTFSSYESLRKELEIWYIKVHLGCLTHFLHRTVLGDSWWMCRYLKLLLLFHSFTYSFVRSFVHMCSLHIRSACFNKWKFHMVCWSNTCNWIFHIVLVLWAVHCCKN